MSYNRFLRDYRLYIRFSEAEVVEIKPPLRIQFQARKTILSDINEAKINVFNLEPSKRNKLVLDKIDDKRYFQVVLQAGYQGSLNDIYIGNIYEAGSKRQGADWITTITCKDGGYDFRKAFTSKTIDKDIDTIDALTKDFKYVKKGKITKKEKRVRPKILIGNTYELIRKHLNKDETCFIDNEQLHIIKNNEVIKEDVVVVNSAAGLLQSPLKQENFIVIETLINPAIKCGRKIKLESENERFNGFYRVETIEYAGDYMGSDWKMTLYCFSAENMKEV